MKTWTKWLLGVLLLAAIAGAAFKAVATKKAQQAKLEEAAAAAKAEVIVDLAPGDLITAAPRQLQVGLPLSGSIKAANTAQVKARVAGELRGLTVREGDRVTAGQVIATVDATEYGARVDQAQRQAASALTQVEIAQRQYDNNKALVNQGFISSTALQTSEATLNGAKASYEAARAGADVARKSLDDTVLRAPISGWVSARLAQPGERVGPDARVIEITDLSRLELEASLSPADSMLVSVGQGATLSIEGLPQPVAARVVRINPTAQAGSRNVMAYLAIDNPGNLRQGLFAQGTLGMSQQSVLAVPLSAVRTDEPQPYVQVVEANKVARKPVTPTVRGVDVSARGLAGGEVWVGVQGIPEGTQVIGGNVGAIAAGTPIKVTAWQKPPAALASAAKSATNK